MYCYTEFKIRYLNNLKLFSVGIKELIEPIVLWKKKSRRVFVLFKSTFFRNRSFSNANWFYSKNRKIWKGNLYLTENRFSRNEMWCAVVNHNHMYHICAKGFLDSYFCWAVNINKIEHTSSWFFLATNMQKQRSELATVNVTVKLVYMLTVSFDINLQDKLNSGSISKPALWSDTRERQAYYAYDIYGKKRERSKKR